VQAIVIGGGISGLACAFRLRELGVSVTLLEASDRFGGVIQSVEKDGFLFEFGPQSFLATEPLLDLIGRLGLADELQVADPRAPRFVLVRGRPVRAPLSPPTLLTTPLMSAGTKLRLIVEPFWRTHPPDSDESIGDFIRRKFGAELLDRLVGPFVSGIYAGDPEQLSLRASFPALHAFELKYGSLIRGALKSRPPKGATRPGLASFRAGVAALPHTLGERLSDAAHLGANVRTVARAAPGGASHYAAEFVRDGRTQKLEADAVIVSLPTPAAASLLSGISPRLAKALQRISYAPVAVVGLGYRREQVRNSLDGFGFLVPRSEKLRILGTVWNSSLFGGRAPDGCVALTSFVGGATDPQAVSLSEDALAAIVEKELASILQISGPPVVRAIRRYERALPQYNLGHVALIAELRDELARVPGLFLTGNYFCGPAIGNCVEQATRTAESVEKYTAALR
jgi:protoporphyrinogen/coproporphyrinogen III oxidase